MYNIIILNSFDTTNSRGIYAVTEVNGIGIQFVSYCIICLRTIAQCHTRMIALINICRASIYTVDEISN